MPPNARRRGWHSDALIGLAVVSGVLVLHTTTDLFSGLERRFYDFASSHNARTPSDRIAIIAIDDQSMANIGRWPWPREVHAQLIDQLKTAGAKTVAHTALFFEPQAAPGLDSLRALRGQIEGGTLTDLGPLSRDTLVRAITEAEQRLDADTRLATTMARAGNVIVPSVFELGEPLGRPDQPLPAFAQKSALVDATGFGFPAAQSQQPIAVVGEAAVAVAHLNQLQDSDGAVRQEPLLLSFDGHAVPSMGLAVAAHSLNLGPQDVRLLPGEAVQLGRQRIATDELALVLPQFYPDRDGRPAFAVDSFYDVVSGKIPASKYAGKIVIVGATAAGVGTVFTTPVASAMPPAVILAHISSSILQGHFIAQPVWGGIAVAALVLAVVIYLVLALPRLSAARGAWVSGSLFVAMLGAEYGLLASSAALWLQLVFPASLLLLGHLALVTRRFGVTEARKVATDAESAETNRMMGLALQGQGQLDMAFDRLRRVPHGEALMDNLKQLALDFERKRQFNKAQSVYEHMAGLDRVDTDVQQRLQRAKSLSETVVLGGGASHPGGTLLLAGGGIEKPMLGRYQVEKELGKGAMGVVYQGRDPKIGRVVAIKTLALGAEFEGSELQDARERFFREAETAGRLQHPNIVTIFDAGEEHDLAFIAMEFLQGRDLLDHARPGALLPVATVLVIGIRVAQALDYAHRQNVVHRDIKPANIMYDPVSDTVKVTDFGIARITDASRTKTGMVLGTPSFMSPEQLAGKHIDGRSDLYSLGVTLFQLLTGTLPLRADSMAALMYQIANEAPPDVRSLRPELPTALTDILSKAMAKAPKDRCQTGAEFAKSLLDLTGQLAIPAGPHSGDDPERGCTQVFEKTLIAPHFHEV
ncbi:CHASE2 domain-containing serine/threonine-protein kinase [Hydrogenophaga sp. A37]|uniref:CHASE2 domain-containing serine/threonine-protein kinase n=1 Tax=Hydrogenophaga sp. A37 TaxID=1945864 RepID=UPI000987C98A|nr:serine/threonine-protein kinase [Hydrogenophaga sp. A37]OOG88904.1 serine/threonine protein kinase [Hydrogenophaga sp. A37]